jgi:hypothetical protein
MEKEDSQQKIDESENDTFQTHFFVSKRSEDILTELDELKKKKDKEKITSIPKDIFLIITYDSSIFNSSLPVGKFISDISSLVFEAGTSTALYRI